MPTTNPSWGRVTAAPHEHLIVIRRGNVIRSQRGGSHFCWPGDTIARVDTSVHRLQFTADQVTREKTGVRVTGLAVFRIVEPEIAYTMLDLGGGGDHEEILREMFVGATRRLVANLTLEDCLTRRKDSLADELMAEVAPVVQGAGRTDDAADRGWGIAIDTIEVQDVNILSEEVFQRLQAPYREQLALEAARAHDEVVKERFVAAAEQERGQERHRLQMIELQEARVEAERQRALEDAAHGEQLHRVEQLADIAREEARAASHLRTSELRTEADRVAGVVQAEVQRLEREAHDTVSQARLQELLLTRTLPEVAAAFRDSFDHITVTGGDMAFLGQGLAQVMATLKAFDVDLPATMSKLRGEEV